MALCNCVGDVLAMGAKREYLTNRTARLSCTKIVRRVPSEITDES